jgi:hypothetical protein
MQASQNREGAARVVRSPATFTVALGDLPDDLELPGDGLVSASQRGGPAGVREWRGGKWEREEASRGGSQLITAGGALGLA